MDTKHDGSSFPSASRERSNQVGAEQSYDLAIVDDAVQMLDVLDKRLKSTGMLESAYVDGVAEMVKILWRNR